MYTDIQVYSTCICVQIYAWYNYTCVQYMCTGIYIYVDSTCVYVQYTGVKLYMFIIHVYCNVCSTCVCVRYMCIRTVHEYSYSCIQLYMCTLIGIQHWFVQYTFEINTCIHDCDHIIYIILYSYILITR